MYSKRRGSKFVPRIEYLSLSTTKWNIIWTLYNLYNKEITISKLYSCFIN